MLFLRLTLAWHWPPTLLSTRGRPVTGSLETPSLLAAGTLEWEGGSQGGQCCWRPRTSQGHRHTQGLCCHITVPLPRLPISQARRENPQVCCTGGTKHTRGSTLEPNSHTLCRAGLHRTHSRTWSLGTESPSTRVSSTHPSQFPPEPDRRSTSREQPGKAASTAAT